MVEELDDVLVGERLTVSPVTGKDSVDLAHALKLARDPVDGQLWLPFVAFSWFMTTLPFYALAHFVNDFLLQAVH